MRDDEFFAAYTMQHRWIILAIYILNLFLEQMNMGKMMTISFVPQRNSSSAQFQVIYLKKEQLVLLKVWSAWPQPLTSVVCHEMLFWCHSQPLWPLLHQHNTSSTPQPSVQLIQPASTCIPTIHFPWRLSFPLSLALSLSPFPSLLHSFTRCPLFSLSLSYNDSEKYDVQSGTEDHIRVVE